ncbi:acyltransferase family protein [Cellulomonas xylanilytica]|uniref:Acyltransferase 3 domain-containing protein n=1 Tax=Cellulomonas xylanilytica TaxID=233583 RepID=A0A510V5V0_9CELL|nr:acyltransferase family protein [Cellulomonas xylanilytica]GEK21311.1 hypothetical protein CXY01_18310 [Cellulomonas xylanilytica]
MTTEPHPSADSGTPRPRLGWVDAGRGIAILLVALFHSANWSAAAGAHVGGWIQVNLVVSSLRMPLFFVLAGLFARKWVLARWSDLWDVKLRLYVWTYFLWTVVGVATFFIGVRMKGEGSLEGVLRVVGASPYAPQLELWFIWALALFFVVAKLTARVPVAAQLAVAGVASVIALSGWETSVPGWSGSVKYYFFFLAGMYARSAVLAFSERVGWGLGTALIVTWAGFSVLLWAMDWRALPGLYFVNCVLGVGAGIALSMAVQNAPLRWIGSRTLPIYLMHTPLIILLAVALHYSGAVDLPGMSVLMPPLLAATAVSVALLVHSRRSSLHCEALFAPPGWFATVRRPADRTAVAAEPRG